MTKPVKILLLVLSFALLADVIMAQARAADACIVAFEKGLKASMQGSNPRSCRTTCRGGGVGERE